MVQRFFKVRLDRRLNLGAVDYRFPAAGNGDRDREETDGDGAADREAHAFAFGEWSQAAIIPGAHRMYA